jgi:hypothetical protein
MGARMNEIENFSVMCKCGKWGNASGYKLPGVVIDKNGVAMEKWHHIPDYVCRFCGKVFDYSYVDIGPVVQDETATAELIPVPAEWLRVKTK